MVIEEDFEIKGDVASIELSTIKRKRSKCLFLYYLWSLYFLQKYNISPGRLAVRTQTLEKSITPEAHIFVKDKDPWIEISNKSICLINFMIGIKFGPKKILERIKK